MGTSSSATIVIVGAGGFGREVLQYLLDTFSSTHECAVKGFVDDQPSDLARFGLPYRVLADTHTYEPSPGDRFVIAVGDPQTRMTLADRFASRGATFLRVVHPRAHVAASASLGAGCVLGPFATVGAHAAVGDHSVLTFCASVGHDAKVGRCCALSPHSVINGGATVADGVFLGSHAVINPLQSVGEGSKVAAGAVVYRDVPPRRLAAGNPAKTRPLW